jgi:hypothetical protein
MYAVEMQKHLDCGRRATSMHLQQGDERFPPLEGSIHGWQVGDQKSDEQQTESGFIKIQVELDKIIGFGEPQGEQRRNAEQDGLNPTRNS